MTVVIDASLTLAWFFEDERTPPVNAVLDQVTAGGAAVPVLWRLEIANAFQMAIRRGRIDGAFRGRALRRLSQMTIAVDREGEAHTWTTVLHLSDTQKLTAYDAAYLELAQRRELPLGTLDRDLVRAANTLGVATLGR